MKSVISRVALAAILSVGFAGSSVADSFAVALGATRGADGSMLVQSGFSSGPRAVASVTTIAGQMPIVIADQVGFPDANFPGIPDYSDITVGAGSQNPYESWIGFE